MLHLQQLLVQPCCDAGVLAATQGLQGLRHLVDLLNLPGKARRKTFYDKIEIPADALPLASAEGPMAGLNPAKMDGLVIDDRQAKKHGDWGSGTGLKGFVGHSYLYSTNSNASIRFEFEAPKDGRQDIRVAYLPHENRGTHVPVKVTVNGKTSEVSIDMSKPAPLKDNFISVGTFDLKKGAKCSVEISAAEAGGHAHADAVQIISVP